MFRPRVLAAAATALSLTAVPALAQVTGDGFQGPRTFGDSQLDQSLVAMNRTLQITDARTNAIFDLVSPAAPSVAELAVALLDQPASPEADLTAPLPRVAGDAKAGFAPVAGDVSLDAALREVHAVQSDRDTPLFLRIAHAATEDLATRFDGGLAGRSEFGPDIAGDATLTIKMVHITDLIAPEAFDRTDIALPVRAFGDATLDAWGAALQTPPTDL